MENEQRGELLMLQPTRRMFLRMCLALPAPILLSACVGQTSTPATPNGAASPGATDAPTSQPAPTAAQKAATQAAPAQAAPTQAAQAQPPAQAAAATVAPQAAQAQPLPPTPECTDAGDDVTPAQTEGPYFTPNSPERASLLEPGMSGTKLTVAGHVLSTSCQPVARALLDFWQADDKGQYDNAGYRLRGHVFTDQAGGYRLDTIVPGLYPGRTRHIHVKVQAPNQPALTTQLYFPGEAGNQRDGIFRPELVMEVQDTSAGKQASFDFVLSRA